MNRLHRTVAALVLSALFLAALPALAAEAKETSRKVVNINAAEATQIALLPRIGPATAQRVVDYRKKNGPFKSAEDLMLVQGVGEKTFALIKPYLSTSGATTLTEKVHASRPKSAEAGH